MVKKGPSDKELDCHCRLLHRRLGISTSVLACDKGLKSLSYTQSLFQLVQNRRGGLVLRLRFFHSFIDSLFGMVPLFIPTQRVDRLFEKFDFFRCLPLPQSRELQRIVNNSKYTFTTDE